MLKTLLSIFCFCSVLYGVNAQGNYVLQHTKTSDKIRFQLINDLIVIPVHVNGVKLSFLLDTGVSKPIIFNFLNVDSLEFNHTEFIYLKGLGSNGKVKALQSKNNAVKIGNALNVNQDLYAVFNESLNLAPKLGIPVHGIIGYDILKDFVVEINYVAKYIKLNDPFRYKMKDCSKCEDFKLQLLNNKPYINSAVTINDKEIPAKLLIDSGGSDALWLFENDSLNIVNTNAHYNDFLGFGLSGSVFGKRSKINSLQLKSFVLNDVKVAYPDSIYIHQATKIKGRNGTLAANVLKRFNIVFDYANKTLRLKKNKYFKTPFAYNRAGIELEHHGIRMVKEYKSVVVVNQLGTSRFDDNKSPISGIDGTYKYAIKPAYTVSVVREHSPAERAGLLAGDIILSINGKEAHHLSLQEITQRFYNAIGDKVRLVIDRDGVEHSFRFTLESPFQQKSLNQND